MQKTTKVLLWITACMLVAYIGSAATTPSIPGWYQTLIKPSFNPPNWIFAPVWTTLFIMMGTAAGLIWDRAHKQSGIALVIFSLQLALNLLWSILFFGYHSPFLAFIEIIFLWLAILATILSFWKISKTAGILLLPYICWVSFAMFLNFIINRLNS